MKIVMRPYHMLSLGGYIVETHFPYRNLIIVNKTAEPIKIEVPVLDESWIDEHRALGLEVIPVRDEDNYLAMFKKAHADLDKFMETVDIDVELI
ncbi:energy-converting hydrogenase B subunit P [Methanobrevibacter acididurans]|uniref:energy-converting hydrogenase B subunit P n=1 Tax=Methanobrevibacter acididurans TaxID=120963 RepID=UPI0038FCF531